MLVELVNDPQGSDQWYIESLSGSRMYCTGQSPVEVKGSDKSNIKNIVKLKREGFTAEEITDLHEAKLL